METRYAAPYYDFERTLQWTYGDKYYLQAGTKGFYDMLDRKHEHSERFPQPTSKQLLDISKRAFEKGELDITEQFLGRAIRKQKIEDASSERNAESYYNLAEVLQQKASNITMQLPKKQKLLLQATALYNFARNCWNKSTVKSEFTRNLLKCLPQKILNVQDSIILSAGGNLSCCKFNSESKRKAMRQLREEARYDLEVIKTIYDTETKNDEELQNIFIKQATEIRIMFQKIASRVKQLLREIIQECVDVLGEPRWNYEVILMGSLAREEMTPYSDLEWAILTDSEEEECKIFFRNLTNLVHLQIINLGETILPCMDIEVLRGDWFYDDVTPRGLSFDGFLPQACKTPLGNTVDFELIHTPDTMAEFQSTYWHKKNPDLGDILLTVAPLHDHKHALLDEYKTNVKKILRELCDLDNCTHDVLSTIPTTGACRGLSILRKDASRYGQTLLDNYKAYDGKLYDVKKEIYRLTDRVMAGLSKVFCVSNNGSFEILNELCENNVICSNAKDNLASAVAIALKLRLSTYLLAEKQEEAIQAKSSEAAATNNAISAYHITGEKELFHFFYVSTPLYELLCRFCADGKNSSEDFVNELFFDCSDVIKGHTYCRILNYAQALHCYNRALDVDPGNVDLQLRQMRIEYMLKKSPDVLPLMKSKLDALLQEIRENSLSDRTLAQEQDEFIEPIAGKNGEKFKDQLIEIYLLNSEINLSQGDLNNARVILEQCQKMEFGLSDLHKLIIRLDLMKISHNQLTHTEFDEIMSQFTTLLKDEGISVRGLVWLNKLGEFLVHHGKSGEAYECFQRALTMGHTLFGSNINFNVVLTLYWLGKVCVDLLMYEEGKFYLEQILTQLPSSKDQFFAMLIKDVYRQLAIISTFTDNHEDAISFLEKALASVMKGATPNLVIDCMTYCRMATIWCKLNESEKALQSVLNANDCLSNKLDIQQKASLTCLVSQTFMEIGKKDEAILLLNQGLAMEQDDMLKVEYLQTLGQFCAEQDLREDAECYYKNALEILRFKNENTADILSTLVNISKILIKNEKSTEAVSYLSDASTYISTMVDNNKKCKYFKMLAECWEELGEYYNARKNLEQAIKVCEISAGNPKPVPHDVFDLHVKLGKLVEKVFTSSSSHEVESSMSAKKEQMKKAQWIHYDRAGVALRKHLATGYFNSTTVRLFALLAWEYHCIDLLEEEKLLLEALKMSERIYGPVDTNELVASILSDLVDVYLSKKEVTSAMHFFGRSLTMEMEIHSSDPYHQHINHQISLLNSLFFECPQWQQFETTMQRVVVFLEQHNRSEAFMTSVGKANCFANMAPLCFFSGDLEKAEKFNQIARDIFATIQPNEISQNVPVETTSCDITSMLLNIVKETSNQDLSNVRNSLLIFREIYRTGLERENLHNTVTSSNTPSSVSRTESSAATFKNEPVLRDSSVCGKPALTKEVSVDSSQKVPLPSKIVELDTVTTGNHSFQDVSVNTDVINGKNQLPRPKIPRDVFQENEVSKQTYSALPNMENNESDELKVSNSTFLHAKPSNEADKRDEVNTVDKNEKDANLSQSEVHERDNLDHNARSKESKKLKSDCENIISMADCVLYDHKQGDLGAALKTTEDSLHSFLVSFYGNLSSDPVKSLINEAVQERKNKNIFGMIRSIDLASKFSLNPERKAKISKLAGECQLYMQNYRMAAISFSKAVCFHRSVSTGVGFDHVEYAESLIGLAKSHLLCNDVRNALCACQEGIAILSGIQPQVTTSRLLVELLFLAAKCTVQLSTHFTFEQDFKQVVSFCQQALGTSEDVDTYSGSSDLTEELGVEKGEFFALKCEIKLLMASTFVRQKNSEEARKIVKELKEFLQNLVVVLEMFSKDTWPTGIDDFSTIQRRMFSWIGRAMVISNEIEDALINLTKSLTIFLAPVSPGAMLPVEEIVTVLDAVTAAIATTSQEGPYSPFQHTLEVCKREFLEQNENLKELWEFYVTLGNRYIECDRTKEAIIIYETGLTVAECMENDGQNESRGQTLLYLANAYRLQAIKKLGNSVLEEHLLAEKYYQCKNGNETENSSILKNIMYAYFLCDERRYEEAIIVLKKTTDLGETLWSRNVICLYSKRVLFGADIQRYIQSSGEVLTNMGNLVYLLLVRAYVELEDKKEATKAYDKLSTDGKDLPASFGFKTSCLPYLRLNCEKYLVSLIKEPKKLSFDESDFPLSAGNLAKLYYELGEYELTLKSCEKATRMATESTSGKETEFFDKLSIVHLAANALVMSGGNYSCYHYKIFLEMLQQKEKLLDKSFDEQQAILSQYSFPEPYYVYHLLGLMLDEESVDNRIACYEHCLRLNPVYDIDQNLVGSLADLYQTKAFTKGKSDKVTFQQWMDKAQDCFQKLLNNNIKMAPFVESTYASFLSRTEHFGEAISHFENVIGSETDDVEVFYSGVDIPLSGVHLAREIQARGKVSLPLKIDLYYRLVLVYLKCGKLEKARESVLQMDNYVKNFASSPKYAIIHSFLAYTYKETGNERMASKIFQAVLDREPNNEPVKLAMKECQTFENTLSSN